MSSENQSEAFYSADEDTNVNSQCSSLRNSMMYSNGTLTRQNSNSAPPTRKKFSSELNIVDRHGQYKSTGLTQNFVPETSKLGLSTHRSDHEIHTPEHRSFMTNRHVDETQRAVQVLNQYCSHSLLDQNELRWKDSYI